MPNISASTYSNWQTCHRLYYWKHIIKLERAREDGARRFGTMYHAGLEAWWREMDGGDVPWRDKDGALVVALHAIADNAKHIDTDPFEVARAEAMMLAYHARYFELDFQSVGSAKQSVEAWFSLPLLDPDGKEVPGWRINGKRDAIKRFADGRSKTVEHKSTAWDIGPGSDYWSAIAINTQVSIYVDAAQRLGEDVDRVLFDVSRKPGSKPLLTTPEENRKFTKGKGCVECGGRAGGKLGVAQGTGRVMKSVVKAGKTFDVDATCEPCNGTGWKEAPALYANQRLVDESFVDFKMRLGDEIASDVDAHFRMADATRTKDQILESRHDLYVATGLMGSLIQMAHATGDVGKTEARRCFDKNTDACTNQYGRRCDYIDVCSGAADPWTSQLYRIKKRETKKAQETLPGVRR